MGRVTDDELLRDLADIKRFGGINPAAKATGRNPKTLHDRAAKIRARMPGALPDGTKHDNRGGWAKEASAKPRIRVKAISDNSADLPDRVMAHIRRRPSSQKDIATAVSSTVAAVQDAIKRLQDNGMRLERAGDLWTLSTTPMAPAFLDGPVHSFLTDDDNTLTFGACGDQHLGSKYERLDVMNALYDAYEEAGCRLVFNCGNWIDGEARFNVHDLHVHGADAQLQYLASVYPRKDGITTYAITGDDHEGWLAQREGVDIGRYAERTFRDAGRQDWVNLGYMEAPVRIVNRHTGKESIMSVTHPGGGSAYAVSYSMQKIVESLDGGEKPAVLLAGHYHKLWSGNIRNVWVVQTGCSQDQTPFMRKKKIEAHVGGSIVKLRQDPATGAITRCLVDTMRFFNRGYYTNRWSHHGPVTMLERAA